MSKFEEIVVIYNPKSTGESKENAEMFRQKVLLLDSSQSVTLRTTEHKGHAEELVNDYVGDEKKKIAIISSSGDGGYHELINGVLSKEAVNISVGVLPSGNANDHFNALSDMETIVRNCVSGETRLVDSIRMTTRSKNNSWERYAHSYIGIGLSAVTGKQLTKADLNAVNEKWIFIKYLFRYTHVKIRIDGKKYRYSSLVFSNIEQMSKILKVSQKSSVSDGKFEVSRVPYKNTFYMLWMIIKSATTGLEEHGLYASYSFETIKSTPVQLDGEVYDIDPDSSVRVESIPRKLRTVL